MFGRRSTLSGIAFLIAAQGLAGCSDCPAAGPTPPIVDQPAPTTITGSVSGPFVGFALVGARVEVVGGPEAGLSTTTDADGLFSLSGRFDHSERLRATKGGYVEAFATPGYANLPVRFVLTPSPLAPPTLAVGDYTLTLAADDACTALPQELRTRTYAVTVTRDLASQPVNGAWVFDVVASGREFLEGLNGFRLDGFPVFAVADAVEFYMNEDGYPYMSERVTPTSYLAFNGGAKGRVMPGGGVSASAAGEVNYCEVASPGGGDYWGRGDPYCPATAVVFKQCRFGRLSLEPR